MKKQTQPIPIVSNYTILRQLSNLIPPHLVAKLARETGVADHERTFSSWSQTVALMFAHLTHAIGLNDVCDALRMNRGPLSALRGRRRPAETISPTPTNIAMPHWPRGCSGRCWRICNR